MLYRLSTISSFLLKNSELIRVCLNLNIKLDLANDERNFSREKDFMVNSSDNTIKTRNEHIFFHVKNQHRDLPRISYFSKN